MDDNKLNSFETMEYDFLNKKADRSKLPNPFNKSKTKMP